MTEIADAMQRLQELAAAGQRRALTAPPAAEAPREGYPVRWEDSGTPRCALPWCRAELRVGRHWCDAHLTRMVGS